ncbi:undecaprenyl-diphosphate phosphatase, partial [bacterium]|nr:undecaprenyl-diphosphate phosphatase [bacterium]
MSFLDAIILGIVEGITEFLPISSTGHLILTSHLLGIAESEFLKTFEIAIQLGAILAVVALYRKTLTTSVEVWKRIIVAFIPTAIFGFVFYQAVKNLLGSQELVLWTLFLGGVFLVLFELFYKKRTNVSSPPAKGEMAKPEGVSPNMTPPPFGHLPLTGEEVATFPLSKAFTIGLFQSVAMIPGVSRSAATIIGGLTLGMERKAIVEFSFLLAIPTMLAATSLDLYKNAGAFSASDFSLLLVGFVVAFITA